MMLTWTYIMIFQENTISEVLLYTH